MTNSWTLQYYFVAHIDVLGQSKELLKLTRLPVTQIEKENTSHILDNTAGYVISLRDNFLSYFETQNKPIGILDSLSEENRAVAEKLGHINVIFTSFSDTNIIAVPLDKEDEHCFSITNIYSALYGICGIFIYALTQQKPFRCGVDTGLAVPLNEHEIYGPALLKAHYLENTIAQYPRIIIGDSLYNYINTVQCLKSDTKYAKWAKKKASECKAFITYDHDRLRILDVIGNSVRSIQDGIPQSWVEKAYKFIVESHDDLQKSDDVKLRARYGSLRSYFESRISLWNIQPINSS